MIGIIGAMEVEIKKLKSLMIDTKEFVKVGRTFYKGKIDDKEVILAVSGVGKVNAAITTSIMLDGFDVKYIINLGVAGGVAPLKTLGLVIGKGIIYHDVDLSAIGYQPGVIPNVPKMFSPDFALTEIAINLADENDIQYTVGNIASGDKFVTDLSCLDYFKDDEIVAVEMEGAAIAHVCYMYHIPFVALRVISDIINSDGQATDYSIVEERAADFAGVFVRGFLKEFKTV